MGTPLKERNDHRQNLKVHLLGYFRITCQAYYWKQQVILSYLIEIVNFTFLKIFHMLAH